MSLLPDLLVRLEPEKGQQLHTPVEKLAPRWSELLLRRKNRSGPYSQERRKQMKFPCSAQAHVGPEEIPAQQGLLGAGLYF